ncbi:MAG TPA: cupin-like domain-containing protein, partial [Lacibacter sp.]|nr:cupin-like domain-containing protein [Lacibacter sp.]
MQLKPVDTFNTISPEQFRRDYYLPGTPVVIKSLAKTWPAYNKWNWDFLKQTAGHHKVGIYNNVKSDAYTPINTA